MVACLFETAMEEVSAAESRKLAQVQSHRRRDPSVILQAGVTAQELASGDVEEETSKRGTKKRRKPGATFTPTIHFQDSNAPSKEKG